MLDDEGSELGVGGQVEEFHVHVLNFAQIADGHVTAGFFGKASGGIGPSHVEADAIPCGGARRLRHRGESSDTHGYYCQKFLHHYSFDRMRCSSSCGALTSFRSELSSQEIAKRLRKGTVRTVWKLVRLF
jgi:hypothetical protein